MTINEVTDRVISSVDNSWTTLEKIRYVYLAVGKMLSKYTDFFFSVDNKLGEQQLSIDEIEIIGKAYDARAHAGYAWHAKRLVHHCYSMPMVPHKTPQDNASLSLPIAENPRLV